MLKKTVKRTLYVIPKDNLLCHEEKAGRHCCSKRNRMINVNSLAIKKDYLEKSM